MVGSCIWNMVINVPPLGEGRVSLWGKVLLALLSGEFCTVLSGPASSCLRNLRWLEFEKFPCFIFSKTSLEVEGLFMVITVLLVHQHQKRDFCIKKCCVP